MNFRQITKFEKCDILKGKNDVEKNGFDKNTPFEKIINIAVKNKCKIVIKNGDRGKWYLKGQGLDVLFLKTKINEAIGCSSRNGVCCYLIED